jgi:hypothetical protein
MIASVSTASITIDRPCVSSGVTGMSISRGVEGCVLHLEERAYSFLTRRVRPPLRTECCLLHGGIDIDAGAVRRPVRAYKQISTISHASLSSEQQQHVEETKGKDMSYLYVPRASPGWPAYPRAKITTWKRAMSDKKKKILHGPSELFFSSVVCTALPKLHELFFP